nr:hypothetical protein [Candidatus Enterovibrio escacola]
MGINNVRRRFCRLLPDFPPCIEKYLISSGIKQRNLLASQFAK